MLTKFGDYFFFCLFKGFRFFYLVKQLVQFFIIIFRGFGGGGSVGGSKVLEQVKLFLSFFVVMKGIMCLVLNVEFINIMFFFFIRNKINDLNNYLFFFQLRFFVVLISYGSWIIFSERMCGRSIVVKCLQTLGFESFS